MQSNRVSDRTVLALALITLLAVVYATILEYRIHGLVVSANNIVSLLGTIFCLVVIYMATTSIVMKLRVHKPGK